jgi:hypothetical protein
MQCLTAFDFFKCIDDSLVKENCLLYVLQIIKYLKKESNYYDGVSKLRHEIGKSSDFNGPSNPHILYNLLATKFLNDKYYSSMMKENLFGEYEEVYKCQACDKVLEDDEEQVNQLSSLVFNIKSILII